MVFYSAKSTPYIRLRPVHQSCQMEYTRGGIKVQMEFSLLKPQLDHTRDQEKILQHNQAISDANPPEGIGEIVQIIGKMQRDQTDFRPLTNKASDFVLVSVGE